MGDILRLVQDGATTIGMTHFGATSDSIIHGAGDMVIPGVIHIMAIPGATLIMAIHGAIPGAITGRTILMVMAAIGIRTMVDTEIHLVFGA